MKSFVSELKLYLINRWVAGMPSRRIRLWCYRKIMKFVIGKNTTIFMDCTFDCGTLLSIGESSVINRGCRLDPRGGISIGSNVSISNGVTILTADHDMDNNMEGRNRQVTIEDYVWIGTNAMIMPGVSVGTGAVIAAGAIVTKDVEAFNVVAGIPAKVIKSRARVSTFGYTAAYNRLFQ
ncbi:acyltransferase [Mucilaginibacter sp. Bleaf8]|uniref:acyltransferase n=1 Tax=Mucilaginibacter sp. Bleaf8 TaxID=2834430 RepID=UPI001BCC17F8|nr:acyltransferase [Mucilaginibacter sp. Bleaf8]MBS7566453.1 acyltransferase [Mucilaginibacter sp. Bleaf8]